jgi:autotransporter-associated beta strand protein
MKHANSIRNYFHIVLLLGALLAAGSGFAATDTWSGGGSPNGNWTNANNWTPVATPATNDFLIFTGGIQLNTTNNFTNASTNLVFGGITFDANAQPFFLYGNTITPAGGITNSSALTQTVDLNIALGGARNFSVSQAAGSLVLGGVVSGAQNISQTGPGTLTLAGTNTFTGAITGIAGTLTVSPTGWLNAGAYAGAITNAGIFNYNGTNAQTFSGVISNAGTFNLNGASNQTLSGTVLNTGAIIVPSASTLTVSGAVTDAGIITFNSTGASTLSGTLSGTGALNQNGSGTLTVSGISPAFAGVVSVNAGELLTPTGSSIGGTVTVAAGATHAVQVNSAGGQVAIGNMTYGSSGAFALFNFAQSPTSVAPLQVSNLTFTGAPIILVSGNVAVLAGDYPLIKYSGTLSGAPPTALAVTIGGVTGTISNNVANNSIDLVVAPGNGNQLTWEVGSGVWNTSASDWFNGTGLAKYVDGDFVTFPDTLPGPVTNAITLGATVTPGGVLFDNSQDSYSLIGTGVITGYASLTKVGAGSVSITNDLTYNGATAVNAGTLTLDFSQGAPLTNLLSSNSPLVLGGGTLNVIGNGNSSVPSSQTFSNTTITTGSSVLSAAPASGSLIISNTVALGALNLGPGGTVMFVGPATSTGITTLTGQNGAVGGPSQTGYVPGAANITTTSGNAGQQLTGSSTGVSPATGLTTVEAFATVGLYDFALVVGSAAPYTIIGASQGTTQTGTTTGADEVNGIDGAYTLVYTAGQLGGSGGGSGGPYDIVGPAVAGRNTDGLTGVRFNNPGPCTFTTGGTPNFGGVLVTPNVGQNNIILGSFSIYRQSATSGPGSMPLWQNNTGGIVFFNGALADNTYGGVDSGSAYVQAGPGLVDFSVANTYNGPSYLNGGVTEILSDAGLGTANSNATIYLNGGTVLAGASCTMDNGGGLKRPFVLGLAGGGFAALSNTAMTVDGLVSSAAVTGPLWIGIPATSANNNTLGLPPGEGPGTANPAFTNAVGTVILSGTNAYTNGTVLYSGALNFNSNSLGTGGIAFNGGTLQWAAGTSYDISAQTVTVGSAGGRLDLNGNSVTLANPIGNSGSGALTVTNGTLTLSAANTYTGGTIIGSGATLIVNNTTGSATGPGPVTVQSGGTLSGPGSVGGALSFNSGGTLALSSSGMGKFMVGSLTISPGAAINVDFTSATNDLIVVTNSGGLTLTPTGAFNLYQAGTLFTFYTPGTYNLVQYSGTLNGLDSTWTTVNANNPHVANAQPGSLYSFGASGGYLTLTIAINPAVVFGIWTGPSGNWNTPADWSSNPNYPQLSGSAAVLGTGSSLTTVTLTGPESVGFLSFTNSNSYVIAGSSALTLNNKGVGVKVNVQGGAANAIQTPLSLGDTASFILLTNQALAISGTISNASSAETITVSGGGVLMLSGNNTYGPAAGSVGTILGAGGLLQVTSPTALGAGDISNASSSTLQAGASLSLANNMDIVSGAVSTVDSQANSLTLNGVISGSGALAKISGGTLTLGGVNTFTGGATIKGGEISISADNNLGPATPALSFIGGGLQSSVSGLSLNVSRNILLGAPGATAATNGYLDAAGSGSLTVPGSIGNAIGNSGQNNLLVNSYPGSTGTVSLEGPGTFTGTTTIPAGVLRLLGNANGTPTNANLSLQDSTVTVNAGAGALVFDASMIAATFGGLSGTGNLTLANSGGTNVTLTIGNNGQNATYSGNLTDGGLGGALVKAGSGTQTMSGNNTYTGATTVNGGTLVIPTGAVLSCGALGGNGFMVTGGLLTNASTITSSLNYAANAIVETAGTINVGEITDTANDDGLSLVVYGGTFISPNIDLGRNNNYAAPTATAPTAALTTVGLYIDSTNTAQPANVTLGQLEIADAHGANSSSSARMDAGTLTVNGEILVGNQGSTGRWSVFQINGGIFTNSDTANGIVLGNSTAAANDSEVLFSGGSNYVQTIHFGTGTDTQAGIGDLIITNSILYMGSGGIVKASGSATYVPTIWLERGTLGALANWSSTLAPNGAGTGFQLPIATNFIIQAADPANNPWNISLLGGIGGVGGITKTGPGTLFLGGTNTYAGNTIVSNGTLSINPNNGIALLASTNIIVEPGAIFDVSQAPAFTIASSGPQNLFGNGTNTGNLTVSAGGQIYAGLSSNAYGTNTFANNLTLASGAGADIALGTVSTGNTSNGLFLVSGNLTLNGNAIHISAPSTSANLAASGGDYVLFSVGGALTGSPITTPVWTVQPANAANFVVLTNSQRQVVLHSYNFLPPTGVASVSPSTLYAGQSATVTVTVTPGGSSTIQSVVLGLGTLGLTTANLQLSSTTNVWTNTITIPNNNLVGSYTLTATITDGNNEIGVVAFSLNVVPGKLWTGAGTPNPNWSDAANWLGLVAPGLSTGDSVTFAGNVNTSPLMDNSYSPLAAVTFYTNAAAFTLSNANSSGLYLTGGVTNNSTNAQTIVLPITASGPITFNAASNDLVFLPGAQGNIIDTGSSPAFNLTVTDGGHNTVISNEIFDNGGLIKSGPGTNTLYAQNLFAGDTTVIGGTVDVASNAVLYVLFSASYGNLNISNGATLTIAPGGMLTQPSPYTGTISNFGTFNYNAGLNMSLTGVISGTGAINVAGGGTNNGDILILDALNTFSGNMIISNTIVSDQIANNTANPTSSGMGNTQATNTIIITNNGVLSFDASGGNELGNGSSSPKTTIVIGQGGVMSISSGNSVLGPLTLNGGTLEPNAGGSLEYMAFELASPVTVGGTSPSLITNTTGGAYAGLNMSVAVTTGNTTFNVASTGSTAPDLTVAVPLADAGGEVTSTIGLIKTGTGRMLLTGQNPYHGATTVSNGILALGHNPATSLDGSISNSSSIVITSNGTLNVTALTSIPGTLSLVPGQTLSGNGTNVGSINALAGSTISPGYSASTGTLTITGALTEAGGAYNQIVLTNNANPNIINVGGNLNASGLNYILISQFGGGAIPLGTNVLITYGGAFNGTLANFSVAISGTIPVIATLANITTTTPKSIAVIITAAPAPTNVVWVGNSSANNWDSSSLNWSTGGSPLAFESGDSVLFTDTGIASVPVNLVLPLYPTSVVVSNAAAHYTFSGLGGISGSVGLVKTNTGTLTILNNNAYTGQTVVGGGTLEITNINASGASPLGGSAANATNLLFYNGAILQYSGSNSPTLAYGITNVGGVTVNVTNPAVTLTETGVLSGTGPLVSSGPGTLALSSANTYAGGTVISNGGTNVLASNVANSSGAVSGVGPTNSPVTFYGGSTLQLYGYGQTNSTTFNNFYNPLVVPAGQSGTLLMFPRTSSNPGLQSSLTGGGTLKVVINFVRSWMGGNWSQFTGLIIVTNLNTGQVNNLADAFEIDNTNGYAQSTIWLQGISVMDYALLSNGTINIGGLRGDPGTILGSGNETAANPTYTVGWLNTTNLFAGSILDPTTNTGPLAGYSTSITKVGTGAWYLGGTNTYTGSTTISNGTLGLTNVTGTDSSITNSTNIFINAGAVLDLSGLKAVPPTLTLPVGGTLGGAGTVKGAVNTAANGGTLSLGIGASGSLVVTNSVTVGGPILVSLDHPAYTGATNGSLTANSLAINSGSTLIVTQGTNDLATGDTFKIFNIATGNPIFTAANLAVTLPVKAPVSGITYVWNTSQLAVNGTLILTTGGPQPPTVNQTPTNMVFSVSGGKVNLSWPANQTGWTLQTNSVNVASNQFWFAYPGSTTVNSESVPISTNGSVFFRLYYP